MREFTELPSLPVMVAISQAIREATGDTHLSEVDEAALAGGLMICRAYALDFERELERRLAER